VKASVLTISAALALATPAVAQTTLELINEYPATSITGEADLLFADLVKSKTGGRVVIKLLPNAESKLRTHEQLKAVTDGRFAMATSFGGALGDDSPVFLMSSLPFIAAKPARQRKIYEESRRHYDELFAERKQKLLYAVPWPSSGIWSRAPLKTAEDLNALKIRTYDKTSTDVMAKVASAATLISFNDLSPKLESGELNAVLSSGDGGAGRALWKHLRYFSAVNYAAPLSFTSISLEAWGRLSDADRAAFEEAARETYERQWTALDARLAQNYTRMRENGVTIDENPPDELLDTLRRAGRGALLQWLDATTMQDRLKAIIDQGKR
jgi:TRAP-type C4-dicarboxylate transport system substrate-binding protein